MRLSGLFLLYLVLLLLMTGCDYIMLLADEGTIIEEKRTLDKFNELFVDVSVKLVLYNDTSNTAFLSGPDFNVKNLQLIQDGKKLFIKNGGFKYVKKDQAVKVMLPVHSSLAITINSPAVILSEDTLYLDIFKMIVNGRGTYTESDIKVVANTILINAYGDNIGKHVLSGRCQKLSSVMEGIVWLDATSIDAKDVSVLQSSMNSVYVSAINRLDVKICSSGNIYYKGNPVIIYEECDGVYSGKVLPIDD